MIYTIRLRLIYQVFLVHEAVISKPKSQQVTKMKTIMLEQTPQVIMYNKIKILKTLWTPSKCWLQTSFSARVNTNLVIDFSVKLIIKKKVLIRGRWDTRAAWVLTSHYVNLTLWCLIHRCKLRKSPWTFARIKTQLVNMFKIKWEILRLWKIRMVKNYHYQEIIKRIL